MSPLASAGTFPAGTSLLTSQGERPVERLETGDELVTIRAGGPEVRLIAHITRQSGAAPYRIRAGAFAPDMPARDLVLSGHHAIYADGALFELAALGNGVSITAEPSKTFIGYRVELEFHDVVLAEGLPVESSPYALREEQMPADPKVVVLYPATRLAARCLPVLGAGRELEEMRRMLKNRFGGRQGSRYFFEKK